MYKDEDGVWHRETPAPRPPRWFEWWCKIEWFFIWLKNYHFNPIKAFQVCRFTEPARMTHWKLARDPEEKEWLKGIIAELQAEDEPDPTL